MFESALLAVILVFAGLLIAKLVKNLKLPRATTIFAIIFILSPIIIGYLFFFFPAVGLLVYAGAEFTIQSFEMGEKSGLSPWRPYLYPYKAVVLSAIFFLFLQGVAEFIKNLKLAGKRKAI